MSRIDGSRGAGGGGGGVHGLGSGFRVLYDLGLRLHGGLSWGLPRV